MVEGVERTKPEAKSKHTIMLQLDKNLYNRLKAVADKLDFPVSTLIRFWIVEKVEEREHTNSA